MGLRSLRSDPGRGLFCFGNDTRSCRGTMESSIRFFWVEDFFYFWEFSVREALEMINIGRVIRRTTFVLIALFLCMLPGTVGAQEPAAAAAAAPAINDIKVAIDTMWVLLTAFLVFFM